MPAAHSVSPMTRTYTGFVTAHALLSKTHGTHFRMTLFPTIYEISNNKTSHTYYHNYKNYAEPSGQAYSTAHIGNPYGKVHGQPTSLPHFQTPPEQTLVKTPSGLLPRSPFSAKPFNALGK